MTEVAFHFNAPDKLVYACRFTRKALRHGARVVITAATPALEQLDRMLWDMHPSDFVAHCRADADRALLQASPVVLAEDAGQAPLRDLLLNLGQTVPPQFAAFARLVEVVSLADEDRAQARQRWRYYSSLGYAIVRHDLVLNQGVA